MKQAIWFVVHSGDVTVHYSDGSTEKMTMQQAEHLFKWHKAQTGHYAYSVPAARLARYLQA